jgi:small subunit ribosomal protein S6
VLRDYELMYIISPDVADDAVSGVIDRVNGLVTTRGGSIKEVNPWGRRRLAYPIKRHLEGTYVVTQLQLEPLKVKEIESTLRISEDILRHLVVTPYA